MYNDVGNFCPRIYLYIFGYQWRIVTLVAKNLQCRQSYSILMLSLLIYKLHLLSNTVAKTPAPTNPAIRLRSFLLATEPPSRRPGNAEKSDWHPGYRKGKLLSSLIIGDE